MSLRCGIFQKGGRAAEYNLLFASDAAAKPEPSIACPNRMRTSVALRCLEANLGTSPRLSFSRANECAQTSIRTRRKRRNGIPRRTPSTVEVSVPGCKATSSTRNGQSKAAARGKPQHVSARHGPVGQRSNRDRPANIAKSDVESIKMIFEDEKVAKKILKAAKRVSKKRASTSEASSSPVKKPKPTYGQPLTPAQLEDSLALPGACKQEEQLLNSSIYTNRAPLVLAFVVTLLKYTMPEQPLSSRLSLSQAVVSANSRSKAVSIGIEAGSSAEEEGWGEGQPVVKVMGRDIRVMKRWGYEWEAKEEDGATQETLKDETNAAKDPALWGLDLEKLKQSSGPITVPSRHGTTNQLPIFTAQSARSYLLKSFETPESNSAQPAGAAAAKEGVARKAAKESNLGLLLGALELLFESWTPILTQEELDKRAWGWYVAVRPNVEPGVAGWGEKGNVRLGDILALRRPIR